VQPKIKLDDLTRLIFDIAKVPAMVYTTKRRKRKGKK
jgi:hypothetical protein